VKTLLRFFSYLYELLTSLRNKLYSQGLVSVYVASVPVVSIGNLTVGGTGKTPLTDFCLKNLVHSGKKVAVISRSYGGQVSQPCRVDVHHPHGARYFGDEPFLLAQANPEVTVFVGSSKWQIARYVESLKENFDLFIVDDGYQHQKLHRDLNILILDATEKIKNYQLVPAGRARESWTGIQRADVIVLTKCNLVPAEKLEELKKILPEGKEVLSFGYDLQSLSGLHGDKKIKADLQGKKFFLVSAIARPEIFESMMKDWGVVSAASLHYKDHHQYNENDFKKIISDFESSGCDYLVTTEKDVVKLKPLAEGLTQGPQIWSVRLEVSELGKRGRLDELIHQCLG
jgi:tetraacyldisaccharide 4'-kinase